MSGHVQRVAACAHCPFFVQHESPVCAVLDANLPPMMEFSSKRLAGCPMVGRTLTWPMDAETERQWSHVLPAVNLAAALFLVGWLMCQDEQWKLMDQALFRVLALADGKMPKGW